MEESLVVPAGVTIDGDDNELKFTTNTGTGGDSAEGLHIPAGLEGAVTIKNLVIDTPSHGDNGIEIYSNANLEDVTVKGSQKNGIYVNNDGTGEIIVNFKNITTSGNAWAGIGLLAQNEGSSIIANFTGTNSFGEAPGVYSDHGTASENDKYKGTITVKQDDAVVTGTNHRNNSSYQKEYGIN